MAIERTFVMVKPDGVARGLVGEIVSRFERKGLTLEDVRMLTIDEELARRHYAEHVEKGFFPELLSFITSGPVVAMAWSGESAVAVGRTLMGPDRSRSEAPPGTIRGDYGTVVTENLVHGSDSSESRRPRARHLLPVISSRPEFAGCAGERRDVPPCRRTAPPHGPHP